MREIGRTGKTIFFVSHDMTSIGRLCNRVIWLDGGRIRQDGAAAEVIDAYLQSIGTLSAESMAEMPIHERLTVSGLRTEFDAAVREQNIAELTEILKRVHITGSAAEAVIEFELGQY